MEALLGFKTHSPSLLFSSQNTARCCPSSPSLVMTTVSGSQRNRFDENSFRIRCRNPQIPLKFHHKFHRGSVITRSDIAAAGFVDNGDNPCAKASEYQLSSRIRGVCFYGVTAVVAIFLFAGMLLMHPFVLLFDRYRRKVHHLCAKVWAALTITPFYKYEIEGMENLPPGDAPAVYVSNHQSFLDIYTLLTLGRSFKFISKRSIFLFPIIGWAMFLLGVIPLRRMDSRSQLECLRRCMDLVKKGASVFFFPEGTRSKDGKLGIFKKGAFSVAAKTGVPVVPITLIGTGKLMPAGKEGVLNSDRVKVVIHKPISGKDAEMLCNEARSTIADTLALHCSE